MEKKLEPEQVKELWKLFKETGDREARGVLITQYVHLVRYVVGRVAVGLPSHVKTEDMYSTGIIGLVKAVERYNPEMKNKFETYAILLIRGAIIDEMRSLDWVPRSVHQKANMVAKAQRDLEQENGREATDPEVADHLGMELPDYESLLARIRPAIMIPLNADKDDDGDSTNIADRIPDHKVVTSFENADRSEFREMLEKAVVDLPEQERIVLVLYYYEGMMLKEIGKVLGVTESRVSQIHSKALLRLRGRLQNFSVEFANMF